MFDQLRFQDFEYGGWQHCLLAETGEWELITTLEVGPRIICLRPVGGANLFREFDDELGRVEGNTYLLFGGHRLWHAPEAFPRSWALDFEPVEHRIQDGRLTVTQVTEQDTGVKKSMQLTLEAPGVFRVRHTLTNTNLWAIELAPWALTIMAPGGVAVVPNEDFRPHPDHLDPARSLTLWHYTKMNDPRIRWHSHHLEIHSDDSHTEKTKLGFMNKQGWAAYVASGTLFIKTFAYREHAVYPDLGSNCEVFTMPGFLELETLGPLTRLEPGAHATHDEIWHVWHTVDLPKTGDALYEALSYYVSELRFPDA